MPRPPSGLWEAEAATQGLFHESTQLAMEKFANVSFNPLVSTEYNIVIVPPGRSSLHSGFQVSHVMAKPAEKPLQPKEQNKIYKQFVWAKEPAAHSACYLIQNKIIAVLIIT